MIRSNLIHNSLPSFPHMYIYVNTPPYKSWLSPNIRFEHYFHRLASDPHGLIHYHAFEVTVSLEMERWSFGDSWSLFRRRWRGSWRGSEGRVCLCELVASRAGIGRDRIQQMRSHLDGWKDREGRSFHRGRDDVGGAGNESSSSQASYLLLLQLLCRIWKMYKKGHYIHVATYVEVKRSTIYGTHWNGKINGRFLHLLKYRSR